MATTSRFYKIGGLRSAIIYALKQVQPHFPLERINILYANLRELVFLDLADTNADTDVTLSRITGSSSAPLPILLPDALGEPLAISHLEDFKSAYKGVAGLSISNSFFTPRSYAFLCTGIATACWW